MASTPLFARLSYGLLRRYMAAPAVRWKRHCAVPRQERLDDLGGRGRGGVRTIVAICTSVLIMMIIKIIKIIMTIITVTIINIVMNMIRIVIAKVGVVSRYRDVAQRVLERHLRPAPLPPHRRHQRLTQ